MDWRNLGTRNRTGTDLRKFQGGGTASKPQQCAEPSRWGWGPHWHDPMTTGGQDHPIPAYPLHLQITAGGMDLGQFCGQQGSLLGRPPGQREFVSSGNSLRLTFSALASEDKTPGLHKGFLALYQAVGEGAPRVHGGKSLPTALAPVSFFYGCAGSSLMHASFL